MDRTPTPKDYRTAAPDSREARLAEALRANLARRKALARAVQARAAGAADDAKDETNGPDATGGVTGKE
ncbi:hypothetical protein CCR83_14555 [Rhodobacter veldkampii DSM 11550]|uniref:Uncharacterized protein n=1 Tax=Phaeovulum veldkampii DSM 11550 TaxID=1185920 RepID=A0A2T4JIQ4_9RHOB|nr:hypothetical protein [Phaeovulum veldkampii]MBK5947637.1 hypothetical protein [Phaeovulum veldkampii DSM 11550]NCU20344.1 hypothetical protein [Candidatus Falkowbacteria bacterium]PTE17790.1 hypothetical protein C5F46_07045 [Phaeovulum veldkampii DSM 11550]TDQ63333.1 hypothetical protein EV658_1027 [Phaeovulum veldkampii DSM 11550]